MLIVDFERAIDLQMDVGQHKSKEVMPDKVFNMMAGGVSACFPRRFINPRNIYL